MVKTITVVTPAFNAQSLLPYAARSLLGQSYQHWEMVVISDDYVDYEAVLSDVGIVDSRFRFMTSERRGSGGSAARNFAMDKVDARYLAHLDADDGFKPNKLELVAEALDRHPIVTTAIEVLSQEYKPLRTVGSGQDELMTAGRHKWRAISMDTNVSWDRNRVDARYDPALPNMTDLDFLMGLYRNSPTSWHIGTPLHEYVKVSTSMSNSAGVTDRMVRAKTILMQRLVDGYYPMPEGAEPEGLMKFLDISLKAEREYDAALSASPTSLLFEDHLEPRLLSARQS